MGISVDDEGSYRACAECTRVCQTTHGEGLPRSVPRFSRPVPDYALPSTKDCNMQIPAFFVREHIPNAKGKYILVGVTGAEWVVSFTCIAFKEGWKAFATDYNLEKGDQVMFALVAPKRFYVDVFDKFGMEKFSTREPVKSRGSPSTAINNGPQVGPRMESPVSNFTSGADGAPQHTPPQALKPNGIYAPSSSGKASGEDGNHDEKLTPSLSRKRSLEPVGNHEAEPSSTSQSSIASDDSVQVQLAKAVLLKSKQKKLKKRKMSCTSSHPVEVVAEAAKSEGSLGAANSEGSLGTEEPELCKNLHNEGEAMKVESIEDRISKGVTMLRSYVDPADSPRGGDDETMFEKPCEDPVVGVSNDGEVAPDVGHEPQDLSNRVPDQTEEAGDQKIPRSDPVVGVSNDREVAPDVDHEPQDLSNRVPDQAEEAGDQKIPRSDQRQDETLEKIETARGEIGEDPVLKGSEARKEEEPDAFQLGVVKQEPDLRVAKCYPHKTCTNCESCGLPKAVKTPVKLRSLKPEPATSESPGTPEIRSPSLNAPSSSTGRVTEDQKQRALIAAKNLSATTINRHAIVVMRVSFNEKTYDCFVSLKCAEMLPSEATELTLLDSKGVLRKANWNADRRFLQGPGWRDFVDSHNLQLNDVFVLEALGNFVLLVHIFHAHEMENLPLHSSPRVTGYVQACPATGYIQACPAKGCVQATPAGPKTRSSNLLHGLSPLSTNRRNNLDEAVRAELPRSRSSPGDPRAATGEFPEPYTTRNPRRASSSTLSTPGSSRAGALSTPPSLSERMKPSSPNVDEAVVRTELARPPPVASTADAAELPGSSLMTRPSRTTSSPLKPATPSLASVPTSDTGDELLRDVVHESLTETVRSEQAKLGGRPKQKAVRVRANLYTPHLRRKVEPKASKPTKQKQQRIPDGSQKEVRTRNSRKVRYPVAEILDRRKSVQGDVLFLVELGTPVSQSSIHRGMKAQQDDKGQWWVPHHLLTKDFTGCFLE